MTQAVQRVVTVAVLPTLEKSMKAAITTNMEALATNVATPLRESLTEHFRRLILENVLPALEASTRAMMGQIHQTITTSLSTRHSSDDHAKELDHERKQSAVIGDLRSTVVQLENNQAMLLKTIGGMAEQMASQTKMLRDMQVALATANTSSISSGGGFHSAPMPPPSPSPATSSAAAAVRDPREEMDRLLRNGQFEPAFVVALSSGRLELVTWICSRLNPAELFSGSPLRLSSPVVLSLIQQLSFQLASRSSSTMALSWLQHALMSLDSKDPAISGHVGGVMTELIRQLDEHTSSITNPSDPSLMTAKFIRHSAKVFLT
jgi:hypothetical protein